MALDLMEPVTPSNEDVEVARESSRQFQRIIRHGRPARMVLSSNGSQTETIEIPASAVPLIKQLLVDMAGGKAIVLIPYEAELTTQQAANILGVSRPFIIKLLETGKLPHRKVGRHRRIVLQDLLDYRRKINAERAKVLDELTALSQEMGIGY